MPSSILPTFLIYCFVSAITPGPANLCSLVSAMKYGKKQALLQWRGLFTGASLRLFFQKYQKPVNTVMALALVFCAVSILRL